MRTKLNSKHPGVLSSALLLGGNAIAQYSPTPVFEGKVGKTLADTKESLPKTQPDAPEDAPNVVWFVIDDIGYGAASAFGGLIETPTLDRLANNGLRYTNFHTCAFRRMILFLALFVPICSGGCSDKNQQSPVEESLIDNEEEILVCNDLLNENVTEIKDIETKLFFEVRDPLGHPQRFGEGISYIKTDSTALFRYYIYYNNYAVGPIIYTYVCDICNFPDYAAEWERQEDGIDIVISGNIYPSFESEKEIHGILELTTLERTKQ